MYLKVCRLCGKDNGLSSVFEESDLCVKIFTCFGVQIHPDDPVSKNICKSCYFFTNTVYEFRVNSIEHDNKLQDEAKAEIKIEIKPTVISYPDISQDAFLNTLNLANKNDSIIRKPVFHPSIINLKRKFPNINLPENCLDLDIDPYVLITPPSKLSDSNHGIWSIKRSQQHDLILTRVRDQQTDNESDSDSKLSKSSPSTSSAPKKKKNVMKYPVYGAKRKRVRSKKSEETELESDESMKKTSRNTYQVEARLFETFEKEQSNIIEQSTLVSPVIELPPSLANKEDYDLGNLLIARGEEVQTFICQTCNKIFDTLLLLKNHKKYSHKSSLRCTKCSKRFAIVESLVKHNLTCHPDSTPKVSEGQNNSGRKTVARKKTGGSIETNITTDNIENNNIETDNIETENIETNNIETDNIETENIETNNIETDNIETDNIETSSDVGTSKNVETSEVEVSEVTNDLDIMEYVISSDDDVEITDVMDNQDSEQAHEQSTSSMQNIVSFALEPQKNTQQELLPQIDDNTNKEKEDANDKTTTSTSVDDDIFLIEDSDDEVEPAINKDSFSEQTDKGIEKSSDTTNSVSNAPSTSTENDSDGQNIVVVPSDEDKELMTSPTVRAKITNEQSYINYIFNKCNYAANSPNQKKWLLKDVQRFTEKTYLPIELNKGTAEQMVVEYGPSTKEKAVDRTAFWDFKNAIDFTGFVEKTWEPAPSKKVQKDFGNENNKRKNNAFTFSKPKKVIQTVQPSTSGVTVKTVQPPVVQSAPKTYQSPKLNQALTTKSQPLPLISRPQTVQSQPKPHINIVSVTCSTPTTSNNIQIKSVHSQAGPNARNTQQVVTRTELNSNAVPPTIISRQLRTNATDTIVQSEYNNPMKYIVQNDNMLNLNNYQVVNNAPLSVANSVVSVAPPIVSSNNTAQAKLINMALKSAATTYMQQKSIKSYSRAQPMMSLFNKPILPVSPTRGTLPNITETDKADQSRLANGYILMGVTNRDGVLQPSQDGSPIIIGEVNDPANKITIPKPIVLNGMPYPSVAKMRGPEQPTYILQPNISIQNSINICQQDITNQSNESYAAILNNQNRNGLYNALPSSNQLAMVSSASNVASVGMNRPAIRIKNLSELRGDNLTENQRNELHNLYTNALTNYVQNHSVMGGESNNDEYLQIS